MLAGFMSLLFWIGICENSWVSYWLSKQEKLGKTSHWLETRNMAVHNNFPEDARGIDISPFLLCE